MIKVVQCWDDGVVDDIRLCQLLREYGAKATFNLNPGLHQKNRSHSWRYQECKDVERLARGELESVYAGFLIANHSATHRRPTQLSLPDWRAEVVDARKALQDIFNQPVTGFAYPYGDYNVAVGEVVREAGHLYARTTRAATPSFPPAEAMALAPDCHHADADFWTRYETAKTMKAPAFYFWGHSYEFITESDWSEFATKLRTLNADPAAVWADLPDLFL
jgi:peptidoglycan-N-acetylglucosamine deacetylase